MKRLAERPDWSRFRFSAIDDVTKNVRAAAMMRDGSECLMGMAIKQRLKPRPFPFHAGTPEGVP